MSSPHYHQGNSQAELAVKRAKILLSKCKEEGADFHLVLLNSRNIPRESNLGSPAERLMSRKLRSLLPTTQTALQRKVVKKVTKNLRKKMTNKEILLQ